MIIKLRSENLMNIKHIYTGMSIAISLNASVAFSQVIVQHLEAV